ncbi:MAG: hypothetical protein AAF633_13480 [Chloroflexota bacterium]
MAVAVSNVGSSVPTVGFTSTGSVGDGTLVGSVGSSIVGKAVGLNGSGSKVGLG